MHEEGTVTPADRMEAAVLSMLLDPDAQRPWSVDEVVREAGDRNGALDALASLIGCGLVNRCGDAVWISRAALRAIEILA